MSENSQEKRLTFAEQNEDLDFDLDEYLEKDQAILQREILQLEKEFMDLQQDYLRVQKTLKEQELEIEILEEQQELADEHLKQQQEFISFYNGNIKNEAEKILGSSKTAEKTMGVSMFGYQSRVAARRENSQNQSLYNNQTYVQRQSVQNSQSHSRGFSQNYIQFE